MHANLTFLLCETGSLAEASGHARRAREMDGSLLLCVLAATVEPGRRRYRDALDLLREADALHPDAVVTLIRRTALLRQTDRLEEAAVACGRTLDLHPDHPGVWRERGLLDMALDRDGDAGTALEKAETLSPHPGRIIADRTMLAIQNGERENRRVRACPDPGRPVRCRVDHVRPRAHDAAGRARSGGRGGEAASGQHAAVDGEAPAA